MASVPHLASSPSSPLAVSSPSPTIFKHPPFIGVITTETPETVDLVNLCGHLQYYVTNPNALSDGTPVAAQQTEGSSLSLDNVAAHTVLESKLFADANGDHQADYGDQVLAHLQGQESFSGKLVLVPATNLGLVDAILKLPAQQGQRTRDMVPPLVFVTTINATEALPPPPQGVGSPAPVTGKGAKKPEVKKADSKSKKGEKVEVGIKALSIEEELTKRKQELLSTGGDGAASMLNSELLNQVQFHRHVVSSSAMAEEVIRTTFMLQAVDSAVTALTSYLAYKDSLFPSPVPKGSDHATTEELAMYRQQISKAGVGEMDSVLFAHCLTGQAAENHNRKANPVLTLQSIMNPDVWKNGPPKPQAPPSPTAAASADPAVVPQSARSAGKESEAPSTVTEEQGEPGPSLNLSAKYPLELKPDVLPTNPDYVSALITQQLLDLGIGRKASAMEASASTRSMAAATVLLEDQCPYNEIIDVDPARNIKLRHRARAAACITQGQDDESAVGGMGLYEMVAAMAAELQLGGANATSDPGAEAYLQKSVDRSMSASEIDFVLLQQQVQLFLRTQWPHLKEASLGPYSYTTKMQPEQYEEKVLEVTAQSIAPLRWECLSLEGGEDATATEKASDPVEIMVGLPSVPEDRIVAEQVDEVFNGVLSFPEFCSRQQFQNLTQANSDCRKVYDVEGNEKHTYDFAGNAMNCSKTVYPHDGSILTTKLSNRTRSCVWQKGDVTSGMHAVITDAAIQGAMERTAAASQRGQWAEFEDDRVSVSPSPTEQNVQVPQGRLPSISGPDGQVSGSMTPTVQDASLRGENTAMPQVADADIGSPKCQPSSQSHGGVPHFTSLPRLSCSFQDGIHFSVQPEVQIPLGGEDKSLPKVQGAARCRITVSGKATVLDFNQPIVPQEAAILHFTVLGDHRLHSQLVKFYDPVSKSIQQRTCNEVGRNVNSNSGIVTRYFTNSSLQQLLFPDGTVATGFTPSTATNPSAQSSWLYTKIDGSQVAKIESPIAARIPTQCVTLEKVASVSTVDRESRGHIVSRADGVMTVCYKAGSTSHNPPDGDDNHTRVVVHAEGTKIVTFLSVNPRMVTPVPAATIEGMGQRRFRVEQPELPALDLFHLNSRDALPDFLVEFNDGTILRHAMLEEGARQTTFHRPSESAVRLDHSRQLAFVEPAPTQYKERSPPAVACCEGVGIYDFLNGAFRLVDYKQHVTEVLHILGGILGVENFPSVSIKKQTVDDILLSLAPSGMDPHTRPKAVHSKSLAKAKAAHEKATNELEVKYQLPSFAFPCALYRLREVVHPFIQEAKIVVGKTATTRAASVKQSGNYPDAWLDCEVRPVIFITRRDGLKLQLLCQNDVTPLVHMAAKNPNITVNASSFSGEPGIEQISFVASASQPVLLNRDGANEDAGVAQGSGASFIKSQRGAQPVGTQARLNATFGRTFEASYFEGTMTAKSARAAGGVDGLSWLPKTLLPPKAPKEKKHLSSFDQAVRQAPISSFVVQSLLRYSPMSDGVKRTVVKGFIKVQRHKEQMQVYGKNLMGRDERTEEEKIEAHQVNVKYHKHLMGHTSGGGDAGEGEEGDSEGHVVPTPPKNKHVSPSRIEKKLITPRTESVNFGTLPKHFRYSLTLTLENHSTNALLFQVRRADLKDSVITVQNGKGLISPMSTSIIIVIASLGPNVVRGVEIERKLYIDCQNCRRPLIVPVTMRIATEEEDFAYALSPAVKVLGPQSQ